MYDAPYQAHTELVAIAESDFATNLAAVESERGISVKHPLNVYAYSIPAENMANVTPPFIEVRMPEGLPVEITSDGGVTTVLDCWILATVASSSLEELTRMAQAYETALARSFLYAKGKLANGAPYNLELIATSPSPPFLFTEGSTMQMVGVRAQMTVVESH